jgi:hypothetical protein
MSTTTLQSRKGNGKTASTAVGEIRTIQQMWDAAIQYFQDGEYDTDAIYLIYKSMNPKLTFQDIANVISAVYGDTYWTGTYLDYSILSKSLVQALGIDRSLGDQYAQTAFSQWRGALCRKNINDIGLIPTPGSYTESLDIVCNENTPLMPQQLIENWNNEFWKTPVVGKNFIYARTQNMAFLGNITPKVQMFYTNAGFNQPPSSWIQCYTDKDPNKKEGNILLIDGKPGPMGQGVRGASEAFSFNPTSHDHVCVIAVLNYEYFATNDPLKIAPGNWNSQTWITHNGAAAWHNVDPVKSTEETLKFYNQDGTEERFAFLVQCRNVAPGSKISLRSEDPTVKFDTGLIEIANAAQHIEKIISLPAYYKGDLKLKLIGPDGKPLQAPAAVEIQMAWVLHHGHRRYMEAVERRKAYNTLRNGQDLYLPAGSFTFTGK